MFRSLSGIKPITIEIIESILVPDLDGIDAKLARNGYNLQSLCEILNARPSEVKSYLLGQLNTSKLVEFNEEINKLGLIWRNLNLTFYGVQYRVN